MPSAQLYNSSNTLHSSPNITSLALNSSSNDEIRVLFGILTLPGQYQRRHFLRLIYGTQTPVGAKVDMKFVMCNLTKEDQEVLVALEIMRYDDIIILDCEENMNKGKTYTYFSSLPEMFNNTNGDYPPYHYVMKADDDAYFRLQNLVDSLKPLPREDLYFGYVIPCSSMEPFGHYMSGMGYLISWDIVEWIRESDIPKNHLEGPEDKTFGDWIKNGHRAKNRFNAKWSMYNFPEPPTKWFLNSAETKFRVYSHSEQISLRLLIPLEVNPVPNPCLLSLQAIFDLDNAGTDLKSELKDLYINSAVQVDVAGNRKAVVIHIPYRLRKAYRKIHVRLVRELEKKFSGKDVILIATRRIARPPKKGSAVQRPRTRTLTAVHEAMLEDVVLPAEIVGKRTRYRLDGSKIMKVFLDPKEQNNTEYKLESFSAVYRKLSGKDVVFEYPITDA
ncbi:unnamed protein product [Prunus brigantina]